MSQGILARNGGRAGRSRRFRMPGADTPHEQEVIRMFVMKLRQQAPDRNRPQKSAFSIGNGHIGIMSLYGEQCDRFSVLTGPHIDRRLAA